MLSLPPDRMRSEIDQVLDIITSIKNRLDAGIIGEELPANDEESEKFQYRLRGELMLASQRLLALGELLSD